MMLPRIRMVPFRLILVGTAAWVLAATAAPAQQPVVVDTLSQGVVYAQYRLPGPVSADVVTVDLRSSSVSLEAFQLPGLVRTSDHVRALVDSGNAVLAALNADFFSFQTGWPVGNTVVGGSIVLGLTTKRSHLVISGRAKPSIERMTFVGSVTTSRGDKFPLGGLNRPSRREWAQLYTPWFGADTGTDTIGVKVLLGQVRVSGQIPDTALYVVTGRLSGGAAPIPVEGGVLAVPEEMLARSEGGFFIGDTLAVVVDLVPPLKGIRQVLGGAGRILRDGICDTLENLSGEELSLKFQSDRHPRSFVAFDRDTTRLFLCTVDGRQEQSRGMSFSEMADFLRMLGAWHALNFDGGGSTTMVVNGRIVNSPSDATGERPVANILALIGHPR